MAAPPPSEVIGHTDAPRCCKRDVFLGLLSAARFARKTLGFHFATGKVRCEFSGMIRECSGSPCPFHGKTPRVPALSA
jgi:hypothetical protein